MKFLDWQGRTWRDRALLIAMLVTVVLLSSHPELRLLVPLIEILGIDLFVMLIGAQAWNYFKPLLTLLHRSLILPLARITYTAMVFVCGYPASCVDAKLAA